MIITQHSNTVASSLKVFIKLVFWLTRLKLKKLFHLQKKNKLYMTIALIVTADTGIKKQACIYRCGIWP
jgi:hypothetical protein